MADHHDGLASPGAGLKGLDGFVERVGVEGAEAFVEVQAPNSAAAASGELGHGEGERETGEETLAAGEGAGRARLAGAAVDDSEVGGEAVAVAGHAREDV